VEGFKGNHLGTSNHRQTLVLFNNGTRKRKGLPVVTGSGAVAPHGKFKTGLTRGKKEERKRCVTGGTAKHIWTEAGTR